MAASPESGTKSVTNMARISRKTGKTTIADVMNALQTFASRGRQTILEARSTGSESTERTEKKHWKNEALQSRKEKKRYHGNITRATASVERAQGKLRNQMETKYNQEKEKMQKADAMMDCNLGANESS